MNLRDALEKGNYDEALKISPVGKNDYNNLQAVITDCERTLYRVEAEFNREPVKHAFVKPLEKEENEVDNEL